MGLVCRVLQEVKVQDDATPLVFPPPKAAVNPDGTPCDSDEVVMCLCNQRTDEFMLDCDECHCWYHGRCVAVTKEVAEAGVTWVCDRCQVREQILRQRQQFATIAKAVEASKLAAAECGPATPKPTKKSASKGQSKKKKKQKRDRFGTCEGRHGGSFGFTACPAVPRTFSIRQLPLLFLTLLPYQAHQTRSMTCLV
jgi:PHD-finger